MTQAFPDDADPKSGDPAADPSPPRGTIDAALDDSLRESQLDRLPVLPKLLQLQCPQCGTRRSVIDDDAWGQAPCEACGSKLSIEKTQRLDIGTVRGSGVVAGQRIGRFELLEQLGSGGFGEVWKARDTQLDRAVAVKFPHRGRLGANDVEKFLREARAAAQLRHPNIVPVHEAGVEGEFLYIVSDFIEGLPLDRWLIREHPAYHVSAALCEKIARALHHAHQQGIVHRDLKPSNVMIDCNGEPHIMDFGLAKRDTGEPTRTVEGQILGTPAYMSPEQARGMSHLADRRADIYSLGVMLYELLTGDRPFRGHLQMLLRQVVQDDPPSPRKLDRHIPRDLETICLKCLQKEPSRRYATCELLAEELSRFQSGVPILARPVSTLERLGRWCWRNPLVASSIALATAGILFGLVAAVVGYVRVSLALEDSRKANARAEANLLDNRHLVADWFTRVSEETLLKEPGMQRLRMDLLKLARDYYEKFLVKNANDPQLQDELGVARFRLGRITEEMRSPSEALPYYQQADEIQQRLLDESPQNIDRLKALGDTLNAMGRVFYNQRQLDRASEAQAAAMKIRKRLTELAPDSREWQRTLANSYMNIGLVELDRGSAQARQWIERAQAIRTELLKSDPRDPKVRRDLAMGDFNLAKKLALPELEKTKAGLPALRPWYELARKSIAEARRLFEELCSADQNDLTLRYQLALCDCVEADLLNYRLGAAAGDEAIRPQPAEAIAAFDKARQIMANLAERSPDVAEYRLALAEIDLSIAQVQQEQGQPDAGVAFERSRAVLAPLMNECGDAARYLHDLTSALYGIGKWHRDPARRTQAVSDLQSLVAHMEKLGTRTAKGELERARAKLAELKQP